MTGPVRAFTRTIRSAGNFHEAIVEREIVSERVLPALGVSSVVRESVADEFVDVRER